MPAPNDNPQQVITTRNAGGDRDTLQGQPLDSVVKEVGKSRQKTDDDEEDDVFRC